MMNLSAHEISTFASNFIDILLTYWPLLLTSAGEGTHGPITTNETVICSDVGGSQPLDAHELGSAGSIGFSPIVLPGSSNY